MNVTRAPHDPDGHNETLPSEHDLLLHQYLTSTGLSSAMEEHVTTNSEKYPETDVAQSSSAQHRRRINHLRLLSYMTVRVLTFYFFLFAALEPEINVSNQNGQ